ncbi:hypothetical protein [Nocardia sp. XZ_19_369]|uniref:hypothetical protein n=1 Tax=Nocardia sp. XZ_19_369 TaxID=2769487 RepID=UPI00188FE92B|nr:hypothetical protein [Nocardia sp. XZ_19_369]
MDRIVSAQRYALPRSPKCRRDVPLDKDGIREWDMVAGLLDGCRRGVPLGVDGGCGWDMVAV